MGGAAEKAGESLGEVREVVTSGPVAAKAKIMGADTEGAELAGEPGLVDRYMAVVAYGPGAAGKRPEAIHDGGGEQATGSGVRKGWSGDRPTEGWSVGVMEPQRVD